MTITGQDPAVETDSAPFSVVLREATREEHSSAEHRGFIRSLMQGELTEVDYWRLLAQYLPVYEALEDAIARAAQTDPLAASFHDPRLDRVAAIRADFTARFGAEHVIDEPLPVTRTYAERIRAAAVPALLAHHYLRYLGDLSGGQAIGALVARHYGVPREQLTMWDFSEIDSPKRVKDAYRERLDSIIDPAVQRAYLAEAAQGYLLAGEMFEALSR